MKAYENVVDDLTHLAIIVGGPEGKENVVARVPLEVKPNGENWRYLGTKQEN